MSNMTFVSTKGTNASCMHNDSNVLFYLGMHMKLEGGSYKVHEVSSQRSSKIVGILSYK